MTLRDSVAVALDAGRPERAWDLAARVWTEGDHRGRHTARRLMVALAHHVPEAAWTEQRKTTARRAGVPLPAPTADLAGVVTFPVVGAGSGRFVEARVAVHDGDRDELPPGLDDVSRHTVTDALDAARGLLRRPTLWFTVCFDAVGSWSGDSAGLAVALAAVTAANCTPISGKLSATGRVTPDGKVHQVGHIPLKLELRQKARPHGYLMVAQADDVLLPWVLPVADLTAALHLAEVGCTVDLDKILDEVRGHEKSGKIIDAARLASRHVDDADLSDAERIELLVVLLAAANHQADGPQQERWSVELDRQLAAGSATEGLAKAIGTRTVRSVDALDFARARTLLALANGHPIEDLDRLHLDGPAALLAVLEGRLDDALALRKANLARASRAERPRCCADLADALLRCGRPEAALAVTDDGLEDVEAGRRRFGYLRQTRAYLELVRARAFAALDRAEDARQALEPVFRATGLDPALRAHLLRAELDGDLEAVEDRARRLLEHERKSVIIQLLLDRSRARLGDTDAQQRLEAHPAFSGLGWREVCERMPY